MRDIELEDVMHPLPDLELDGDAGTGWQQQGLTNTNAKQGKLSRDAVATLASVADLKGACC